MRYQSLRGIQLLLSVITFTATFACSITPAAALTNCSGGVNINANTTLTDDYYTTSNASPCLFVRGGSDVNLNGHSITCTGASCSSAISCETTGSLIRSTVSADGGHIDIGGPFATGVLGCNDHEDLLIDGPAVAISSANLDTVHNCVLRNCSTTCIVATMTANADRIYENIIDANGGGDGISVVGKTTSTGGSIDHNLIRRFDIGIYNSDSTYVRIENNIFVEGSGTNDPISVGASNKTFTNNLCENDAHCANEYGGIMPPVGSILY